MQCVLYLLQWEKRITQPFWVAKGQLTDPVWIPRVRVGPDMQDNGPADKDRRKDQPKRSRFRIVN